MRFVIPHNDVFRARRAETRHHVTALRIFNEQLVSGRPPEALPPTTPYAPQSTLPTLRRRAALSIAEAHVNLQLRSSPTNKDISIIRIAAADEVEQLNLNTSIATFTCLGGLRAADRQANTLDIPPMRLDGGAAIDLAQHGSNA